jgi:hypothetical protein
MRKQASVQALLFGTQFVDFFRLADSVVQHPPATHYINPASITSLSSGLSQAGRSSSSA